MIITVSGTIGSGKSLVTKTLKKEFDFERLLVGDIWRERAADAKMSLNEYEEKVIKHDPSLDQKMDEEVVSRARELDLVHPGVFIEGRVQWYFLPESIKLYLYCEPEVAARRIYAAKRPSEQENTSYDATLENVHFRNAANQKRYFDTYGIDITDKNNYDYVLDTSNFTKQESLAAVREIVARHL